MQTNKHITANRRPLARQTAALALAMAMGLASAAANAVLLTTGAASDDWGDPDSGLNTTDGPNGVFLRVFGRTEITTGFNFRRGALEFDVSSISAGATVTSAELFLVPDGTVTDAAMQLHTFAGDGLVQTADLGDGTLHSLFNLVTNVNNPLMFDVKSFIQELVDGSQDFAGFMLRATNEGPSAFNGADFTSSENTSVNDRPLLTVEWQANGVVPMPEPLPISLFGLGLLGLGLARRRRAAAG